MFRTIKDDVCKWCETTIKLTERCVIHQDGSFECEKCYMEIHNLNTPQMFLWKLEKSKGKKIHG